MTAPIINLVEKLPASVANREAVEILEKYLEEAKAGRVIAVGLAAVTSNGRVTTVSSRDSAELLGAVEHLAWRINSGLDASGSEIPDGNGGAA